MTTPAATGRAADVTAFERPLRIRAEAAVRIAWGLVTAFAFSTLPAAANALPWPWFLLAIPLWIAVGGLLARAVWRVAGAALQQARPAPLGTAWLGVAAAAALALGTLLGVFPLPLHPAAHILSVVALCWLVVAALSRRATAEARRATLVTGAAIALLALAYVPIAPGWRDGTGGDMLPIALIAGGVPIVAGLWLSGRRA